MQETEKPELEHYQTRQVRDAIGREIARMIPVNDELKAAKVQMDEAQAAYRDAIRQAVRKIMERF